MSTRCDCGRKTATALAMRPFAVIGALGFCLLASGCGGTGAKPVTAAEWRELLREATAPPRLQAGEKIQVIVYGKSSLSNDYQIDPSGFVSLPLAGTVKAAGLTQQQLEHSLEKHFGSKYLKDPKVTVEISEFRPFYIVGEVDKPGAYPYTGGLNVLSAIAIAGGTTYRADNSEVLIQHAGESKMREFDTSSPIPILPGDIIKVPRRYF